MADHVAIPTLAEMLLALQTDQPFARVCPLRPAGEKRGIGTVLRDASLDVQADVVVCPPMHHDVSISNVRFVARAVHHPQRRVALDLGGGQARDVCRVQRGGVQDCAADGGVGVAQGDLFRNQPENVLPCDPVRPGGLDVAEGLARAREWGRRR